MDIHVDTGILQNTVQKRKIIVGLLVEMEKMMEGLGVIQLVISVGKDVIYKYVLVSKINPI
jgi:hypothetical protein